MSKLNLLERIERHTLEMRDGQCWVTDFAPHIKGYVYINNQRLHRVAWEAHNAEPIPEGMVVRHTCDNPLCFNPEHLVLGTQLDNIADCITRGRKTSPPPKEPLSSDLVSYIQELWDDNFTVTEICSLTGVGIGTIYKYY